MIFMLIHKIYNLKQNLNIDNNKLSSIEIIICLLNLFT